MGFWSLISSILILLGRPILIGLKLLLAVFKAIGKLILSFKLPLFRLPIITKRRVGVVFFLFLVFWVFFTPVLFFFHSLPSPLALTERELVLTTKIYARDGETLLYKIYKTQNRSLVELKDIPEHLIWAAIAIEDKDFYKHRGLSLRGIIRAIRVNWLKQDVVEGGSTITQQLVKNALLTPERTFWRKFKEIVLAIEAELIYSKNEILTMYFNEVGFGGAAYGIEEASEMYFGKKAADLALGESALLAGLPAAPTYYSPFGVNPERAKIRQRQVLRRMYEDGYISYQEMSEAEKEELVFAKQRTDIKAPHFVMYIKELLVEKYGEKMVEQGGLTIITSLDPEIQEMAEREIWEGVEKQKYLLVGNGAALVTKPATGEVLAMVGSKDYFDEVNDGNVNVTMRLRQPGSAIKPVNYVAALTEGFSPTTILEDTPVTYRFKDSKPYSPVNYDGKFRGRVSLRQALGNSLNVPAVKVLASYGVEKMIETGKLMGITTWGDKERFGYSLTLGGGDVKMIDLALVFGTLANLGEKVELDPILYVSDYKGRVLKDYKERGEKTTVISPGAAFIVSNILADNEARKSVFGPNSPLVIEGHTVAVKTGTTDTKRDNWTIGYTPDYLVGVWIGNNDNSPMSPYLESGASGAAPIWNKIMSQVLEGKKDSPFEMPPEIIGVKICATNGLLPCKGCPKVVKEYFLRGTEPKTACKPSSFVKKRQVIEKK